VIYFFIIVFATVLTLSADQEGQAASAQTKIIVTHSGMNTRQVPLWITQEQGFFTKQGVDTELVFIRTAPLQVAGIASGQVQIGYTAAATILAAAAGGADLKILAAFTNRLTYDLVARPEVKKPAELRGKRFGVQSIAGAVWMGAMLGLEHLGLDPRRDNINILVVGDQTVLTQALETGAIDATVLDGVFSRRLKQKGFTVLADLYQANIPYISNVIAVTGPYLQQHAKVSENVLKALIEGVSFSMSPAKKPIVLKTIMKRLKITDPAVTEEGYQDLMKTISRKPYASLDGINNVHRLMKLHNPAVNNVKVEDLIDNRITKRLDESGFIDQLYSDYGVKQ
jgi:ABC-type nitrate/sulfonate/bicarbonate transport system substrate-binding protein